MANVHLAPYEVIVDFIADFLGKKAEVVLHDLSDIEQSIYKIRNGYISGRECGDPITDLVAKALKVNDSNIKYQCNYIGVSKQNNKLKCATYYIRDSKKNIVGALCINMLIDDFIYAKDFIDDFLQGCQEKESGQNIDEHIGMTVPEMVDSRMVSIISSFNIPKSHLTQNDKLDIISQLNDEGVFLLKGTVHKVASELELSEPTVYKYLQKVK